MQIAISISRIVGPETLEKIVEFEIVAEVSEQTTGFPLPFDADDELDELQIQFKNSLKALENLMETLGAQVCSREISIPRKEILRTNLTLQHFDLEGSEATVFAKALGKELLIGTISEIPSDFEEVKSFIISIIQALLEADQ